MSKFLKVMIVLLTIAAVATPVIAEDRLSIGGEMRVRGWAVDDGNDYDSRMDQRLRMGGKFSIAEGVSVTFRTDVTEQTWGNGGSEFGSGRMATIQQWDRAHMDLTMGNVHIRAGQQWAGFGLMGGTVNSQDAGLRVDVKGPIAVSAFWLLDDRNGGASTADSYLTAVNVAHKTDSYAANVFLANQVKAMDVNESVYLLGVNTKMNLNAIKIAAELDFFFGDATWNSDAVGTQLLVDASMAASDTMTVGGQFLYAMAADSGEVQYQGLGNDFNGYDPIADVGTSLSNEQIGYGRPFDFTGANAGVIGARLYTNIKTSDALSVGASLAYLVPEDDNMTSVDSLLAVVAGAKYALMSNTSLQAQVEYSDLDAPGAESTLSAGVGLFVNF